jgi:hypothetical protein
MCPGCLSFGPSPWDAKFIVRDQTRTHGILHTTGPDDVGVSSLWALASRPPCPIQHLSVQDMDKGRETYAACEVIEGQRYVLPAFFDKALWLGFKVVM